MSLLRKERLGFFMDNCWKIGLLLTPTSGHTDPHVPPLFLNSRCAISIFSLAVFVNSFGTPKIFSAGLADTKFDGKNTDGLYSC